MDERHEAALMAVVQSSRQALRHEAPQSLAARGGLAYDEEGGFHLRVLGQDYLVSYPDFVAREAGHGQEAPVWVQSLVMYYLTAADGAPWRGEWVSLRELPGGLFYERAFQGYSGDVLARAFGNDLARFAAAAAGAGGQRESLGDAAFSFLALPRVPVAIVYWLGDEDFPPSARVLFDAGVNHYLPTGALPLIGRRLCQLVLEAAGLAKPRPPRP